MSVSFPVWLMFSLCFASGYLAATIIAGFYCCAYDGFGQCGCDFCPEPECWDFEDDDPADYDDWDYDCACRQPSAAFRCVEATGRSA